MRILRVLDMTAELRSYLYLYLYLPPPEPETGPLDSDRRAARGLDHGGASMGCSNRTRRARRSAYTDGSTTNPLFLPVIQIDVNDSTEVRPSYEMEANTGACLVRIGVRYTTDGYTWGAVTDLGPAFSSTNQMNWGTAYVTPDAGSQAAQYGFSTKNASGSNREMAQLLLLLDIRGG